MPSVTAQDLITAAYQILGVYSPVQTPSDEDAQLGLDSLNDMLSEWSLGAAFSPFVARERFDLQADKGGEDDPYTIGSGGDFDTTRPTTQDAIQAANLILTATTPEVRVNLGPYTDMGYFANLIPGMSNTLPTAFYYNPTYANDLGAVYLWPVPTTDENDIEFLLQKNIAQFADLDTSYDLPDGLPRALKYNLAETLSPQFRDMPPVAHQIAVSSLARWKRENRRLSDLANDQSWAGHRRTYYNINSNAGG